MTPPRRPYLVTVTVRFTATHRAAREIARLLREQVAKVLKVGKRSRAISVTLDSEVDE